MIPFPKKKYNIILSDPPWAYNDRRKVRKDSGKPTCGIGAGIHYDLMENEDICNLPVQDISADNCILFLWATFPKLQEGLNTIKAWGFEYKTVGFTWIKKNKNFSNFFGVGWYTKSNAEVCLIGAKGKPPKASNSISSIIETCRQEHSRKPSLVRDKIVEFAGDLPRIELFARKRSPGWDSWGNQL